MYGGAQSAAARASLCRSLDIPTGISTNALVDALNALITKEKTVVTNECTTVHFDTVDESDIERYLDTDEAYDKAGAYGIQEKACLFVEYIKGDFFNIVGLPISAIQPYLAKSGILPLWQKDEA